MKVHNVAQVNVEVSPEYILSSKARKCESKLIWTAISFTAPLPRFIISFLSPPRSLRPWRHILYGSRPQSPRSSFWSTWTSSIQPIKRTENWLRYQMPRYLHRTAACLASALNITSSCCLYWSWDPFSWLPKPSYFSRSLCKRAESLNGWKVTFSQVDRTHIFIKTFIYLLQFVFVPRTTFMGYACSNRFKIPRNLSFLRVLAYLTFWGIV